MTDTVSARTVPESPVQAARMRAFLRWLLPIATFFGAIELFAWVPTRDLPTGLTGLFILMSGYTEQEASARFVGRGLAGFLQKPFTAQELLAVVSQVKKGAARG